MSSPQPPSRRPVPDPLGPEWGTEADGTRTRRAARVLLLDGAGRVLLLRGADPTVPGSGWWFTPGGGLAPGESARAAAVRELAEETGIVAAEADLVGPVLRRAATFRWLGATCRQEEELFLLVLPGDGVPVLDRAGWTPLERRTLAEVRWWSPVELAGATEPVFPTGLHEHALRLRNGWDGRLREVP